MLSLSLQQHHRGSIADAFTSAVHMVFRSGLTLVIFVLVVVLACFNTQNQFFFFFSKVFKLLSSDLEFRFRDYVWGLGLGIRFSTFLPSLLQVAHSSCITVMLQAADE